MENIKIDNYFNTFEYNELIKQLTNEIIGCNARVKVFINENKIFGHESTLLQLSKFKDIVTEYYRNLRFKELTLPTKEKAEEYTNNLVKTWHLFHDFEKSIAKGKVESSFHSRIVLVKYSLIRNELHKEMKEQANDPKVIAYYKQQAEEFGDIGLEIIE